MADVFSVVRQRGWGSRLKGAFSGVLFGLLLVLAAFGLEWWNEGRAVHRAQDLAEGAASVVIVPDAAVRGENNGKLIHVSGKVSAEAPLGDPDFGFSVTALSLQRSVEMYQWVEKRESNSRKKLGGGEETVTSYSYEKQWTSRLEDSSRFGQPEGHQNPERMPISNGEWTADAGRLGGFRLGRDLLAQLAGREPFAPPLDAQPADPSFKRVGNGFYREVGPSRPAVGDVQVNYAFVPEGVHSVIAAQSGSSLRPYTTSSGRSLLLLRQGTVAAEDMFNKAQADNTALTWVLRVAGVVLMWLGLSLLMKPLVVLFEVLPVAGRIVGAGIGLIALLIAVPLSLFTMALAWLWYRPLVGLFLIGLGVAAIWILRSRMRRQAVIEAPLASSAFQPPSPPPPPPAST